VAVRRNYRGSVEVLGIIHAIPLSWELKVGRESGVRQNKETPEGSRHRIPPGAFVQPKARRTLEKRFSAGVMGHQKPQLFFFSHEAPRTTVSIVCRGLSRWSRSGGQPAEQTDHHIDDREDEKDRDN
jgi:hypothetical protein